MTDFMTQMTANADLSLAEQKSAGAALGGDMGQKHKDFVKNLSTMIEAGKIDPSSIQTILNKEVYDHLNEVVKAKVDYALPNIAILLTHVIGFYRSKQTPDACPQLETMIEQLWEMKERLEVHRDIFIF